MSFVCNPARPRNEGYPFHFCQGCAMYLYSCVDREKLSFPFHMLAEGLITGAVTPYEISPELRP
jgi:hypothetical protein